MYVKEQILQPVLTAHSWKIWKTVFLTCPWHEIYRNEEVGLESYKYTSKN